MGLKRRTLFRRFRQSGQEIIKADPNMGSIGMVGRKNKVEVV
jgi:hypothetical protein